MHTGQLRAAAVAVALLMAACGDGTSDEAISSPRGSDTDGYASTTVDPCLVPDPEASRCGIPFDELHELNLRHADRLEFSGDLEVAYAVLVDVEARMQELLTTSGSPTVEQVEQALQEIGEPVNASSESVGASGVGFGVQVDGGCVFGHVGNGSFEAEIGGFVNDGGCLALYGH